MNHENHKNCSNLNIYTTTLYFHNQIVEITYLLANIVEIALIKQFQQCIKNCFSNQRNGLYYIILQELRDKQTFIWFEKQMF